MVDCRFALAANPIAVELAHCVERVRQVTAACLVATWACSSASISSVPATGESEVLA